MPPTMQLPPIDAPPVPEATLVDRARRGDQDAFAALIAALRAPDLRLHLPDDGRRRRRRRPGAGDLRQGLPGAGEHARRPERVGLAAPDRRRTPAWTCCAAASGCAGCRGTARSTTTCCGATRPTTRSAPPSAGEARAAVRRALAAVSPRHRRALTLREYEGLSCAEISQAMGLSRAAVKSLLFRARLELRAVYAAAERPAGEGAP